MSWRSEDLPRLPRSPVRVFVLVLLLVFAVEGAIMLCLPQLPGAGHGPLLDGLLDAFALTLIAAPALWYLTVFPLRRLFEARGTLLRRLFESQEQERAHVARDLHDGVGQQLTTLLVGLRGIADAPDLAHASALARELREVASSAHADVRQLARGLRPLLLEELGLVAALERLCEDFERSHGVKATFRADTGAGRRSEPAAEAALYRIAQEALSNVARHARAHSVEVELVREDDATRLRVRDDGRGFELPDAAPRGDGGFGLGSMRERAFLLGGELRIATQRGGGTTLEVRVPTAGAA